MLDPSPVKEMPPNSLLILVHVFVLSELLAHPSIPVRAGGLTFYIRTTCLSPIPERTHSSLEARDPLLVN